jgi:peptide methionine sulfoxide reductase MsrA
MFDSDEDIQKPNYKEILSGATNYHDVVKAHFHSTLKVLTKNPL